MNQCKFCGAQLEENSTVCPGCGKDNAEAPLTETVVPAQELPETEAVQEVPATEAVQDDPDTGTVQEEEAAQEEAKPEAPKSRWKFTPARIAAAVVAFVVLAALLAGLLLRGTGLDPLAALKGAASGEKTEGTIPPDGNPDDETCKGSYTVSDKKVKKAADTVVATAGEYELTNAQLQIYYWLEVQNWLNSYGSYAPYFGLDYTQPLDTQECSIMEGHTWQQYFLTTALHAWQRYQSLAAIGMEAGYEMDADMVEYLNTLQEQMEAEALAGGFENAQALMAYNVGAGATIEDYQAFMELYYRGVGYFNQEFATFTATDEEIAAMFDAHEEEYAAQGLTKESKTVNVRHILIMPEGADSSTIRTETFSDEAWAWAETESQRIMDLFLEGDLSEDSFAQLAMEHSADGSAANGGLYTGVEEGQMVQNFNDWCFDSARKVGDYGIVKTEFGYHLMFYSGEDLLWMAACESDVLNEKAENFLNSAVEQYPMVVDYSKIKLGFVDLAG